MLQLGATSTANRTRKSQRLTPLEHPSTVSALRADPPSPTRGEGKLAATPALSLQRRRLAKAAKTASFAPFTGRRWRQPDEGRR
ncbi:hypothetical protein FJ949_01685 [Mesorhizobium sp. B2-4-1]|nr:hypothetical protein FJ944_05495 [Mesorhizobium sp. B2-4-11]TPL19420.1 hypothetical protein FJ952_10985 [Mesorhizobium sp. B2-4-10]TPL38161.1 hypothetical protein FJ947_07120 [Mesorhizobium sp. B2-4-8]TPL69599.1 hypothetical protein FJ949_01685 [Mesorhizobium sp. B2-4-1]